MKRIPLTQGKFALVDDEDFELVSRFKWQVSYGYARTNVRLGRISGKRKMAGMSLHRLIMRPPKGMEVDHRNHNPLDCRRGNMRSCTRQENSRNQVKRKGTSSRFKGVCWYKDRAKWMAHIRLAGKRIYLGVFSDEAEAALVYDAKAKELFGEFAYVNFQNRRRN